MTLNLTNVASLFLVYEELVGCCVSVGVCQSACSRSIASNTHSPFVTERI